MNILQVHNFYQQAGGEDRVLAAERQLLQAQGHTVSQYTAHNDAITHLPALTLAGKTIWNQETYRNIRRLIVDSVIDLLHVHNTLPLISPAVYWAARAQGVPVVQTLHNYRLLCPAATFYREGKVCELCLHKSIKLPAVTHRCYRHSLAASAGVGAMLATHNGLGTFQNKINTYIALTDFAKDKFTAGGLPAERIKVKPNFLAHDPGAGAGAGGYALFAGRLTEEKGLVPLLEAWSQSPQALPLKIVGDGPMQTYVRERAASLGNVEYLGHCTPDRVIALLKDAACLMLPSLWYEGLPMVVIEALACGTPVVAFGLGALQTLIIDGVNGIKLLLANPRALVDFANNSSQFTRKLPALRRGARGYFEEHFTAETNFRLLLEIYQQTLNQPCSVS